MPRTEYGQRDAPLDPIPRLTSVSTRKRRVSAGIVRAQPSRVAPKPMISSTAGPCPTL